MTSPGFVPNDPNRGTDDNTAAQLPFPSLAPSGTPAVGATLVVTAIVNGKPVLSWSATSGGDTTKPVVTSFTTSAGDSQVMLAWSGTDNVGITGWTLKRGGTTVYSGTATSFTDTGLTNGTANSYTLTASDAAGNVSAAATTSATPAPPASAGYGATPYGTGAYGQ